jgi:hypothetical protein
MVYSIDAIFPPKSTLLEPLRMMSIDLRPLCSISSPLHFNRLASRHSNLDPNNPI